MIFACVLRRAGVGSFPSGDIKGFVGFAGWALRDMSDGELVPEFRDWSRVVIYGGPRT